MIATLILAASLAATDGLEYSGICRGCQGYYVVSDHSTDTRNQFVRVFTDADEWKLDRTFTIRSPGGGLVRLIDPEGITAGESHVWVLDAGPPMRLIEATEPKEWGENAKLVRIYEFECFRMRPGACFYCPEIKSWPPVGIICAANDHRLMGYNGTVWAVKDKELVKIGSVPSILPVGGADWHNGKLLLSQYTGYQQVAFEPEDPVFGYGPSRGHVEAICFGFDGSVIEVSESGRVFK